MLLSNPVPDWMKETQQAVMPGTVIIQRYTAISNNAGMQYENWQAVGTAIGRIYPQTRRGMGEVVGGAMLLSITSWFATLPVGTDVLARDRLLYASRTWEVTRVNNDEMWQTAVRCELEAHNQENRS